MLVDGKWTADWRPVPATGAKGGFVRQISGFRHAVSPDDPKLCADLPRMLALPGVRETVNLDLIRRGDYVIAALSPTRIVTPGPEGPGLTPVPLSRISA